MRTSSRYETYLIIGRLVNERYQVIQDQILLVQKQTK